MRVEASRVKGVLRDLDTGEIVKGLIWFDLEKGLFEKRQFDRDGQPIKCNEGYLTHRCKGRIRFEAYRSKRSPIPLLDAPEKCEACSRQAKYMVSDETPLPPVVVPGRRFSFEQAKTVDMRFYCEWCYQGPRIVDAKGEIMEVIEDGGGVRPQWHS